MSHLLIIGGSDAGISAGLRARQLDPSCTVTVVHADSFPNYIICGLPFHVSGETPDWHDLAHRTREDLEAQGLDLLLNHQAIKIDPLAKSVEVADQRGHRNRISYDKLIIGTGAEPAKPPIQGLDTDGVLVLHIMENSFRIHDVVVERSLRKALIIGGGYIGLEMADALRHRGLQVTLVEQAEAVMTTVDTSLGQLLGRELKGRAVEVVTGVAVE